MARCPKLEMAGVGNAPRRLLCGVILLACIGWQGASHRALATPFMPATDAAILEQIPGARDPSSRALKQLNSRLSQDRQNLALAEQVAGLDIAQARRLGDPRFLGRAQAALAPWPIGPATPQPVLLLRAVVLQSNHDFAGSIAALSRIVATGKDAPQAWLTLASVHQAQGDYKAALHDCGQFATHTLGIAPDTCTAGIMSLTGHAPLALRALSLSLTQNAAETQADPAVGAWATTLAAEIAERLGDPSAEAHYRAAMAIDDTDPYLLAAWSDFLLDHDRPREVIDLLQDRTRIDPLLLRLALAEQATGDSRTARHVADLAARFDASRLRGDTVHRREEAIFALFLQRAPLRALELARANWDVQREPADARILLQAAIAANRPSAADPVRTWLRENSVEDVRLKRLAAEGASLDGTQSRAAAAGSSL